jgi:aspartyl-tRNA(Asn)/glutamyl-tRNA(Gln) amidotransferase subunit A
VEHHLAGIVQLDGELNAFLRVFAVSALEQAEDVDAARASGLPLGPLAGVPVAIKDIFDMAGERTTCHSRVGPPEPAAQDADAVRELRAAGAILIGKTALHEFATGGPSFDLPWPPARNPWNRHHHPGGSSSGSGAAVAAGLVPAALGTDTAGSVRHPATACGVAGLKPTYGAISCSGVFPLSQSLDHVGPIANSVIDLALLYDVLRAPQAPFSRHAFAAGMTLRGHVFGVADDFMRGADPEIESGFLAALEAVRQAGGKLVPLEVPPLEAYAGCGRLILQAEAYAIHKDRIDARPEDYGRRGRQRILAGRSVSAADYINAQRLRRQLAERMDAALQTVDAMLCPSSLSLPCRIDDDVAIARTYDHQARTPFNVTGHPAIALPTGIGPSGLPLGLQIIGRHWSETRLLSLAAALETVLVPMPRPPLSLSNGDLVHAAS